MANAAGARLDDFYGPNAGYALELFERDAEHARQRLSRDGLAPSANGPSVSAVDAGIDGGANATVVDSRVAGAEQQRGQRRRGGRGPGPEHPPLRSPRRPARPPRLRAARRPAARPCRPRPGRRRPARAARYRRRRPDRPRQSRPLPPRPSSDSSRSTAARPATSSRTSRTRPSAPGCSTRSKQERFRPPQRPDRRARAARPPDRGLGLRAIPAPRLPRPDALLGRRAGHAHPDAGRADRRRRRAAARASILLGMAHRGRLNVLAHVLGKPYARILAEFEGREPRAPRRAVREHRRGLGGRRQVPRRRAPRLSTARRRPTARSPS